LIGKGEIHQYSFGLSDPKVSVSERVWKLEGKIDEIWRFCGSLMQNVEDRRVVDVDRWINADTEKDGSKVEHPLLLL
jgi:hypothetical protein